VVLDIAMLVDTVGNIVGRQIGDLREQFLELAGCLLLIGLQRRNGVLESATSAISARAPASFLRALASAISFEAELRRASACSSLAMLVGGARRSQ
jgi:hypothetical protein